MASHTSYMTSYRLPSAMKVVTVYQVSVTHGSIQDALLHAQILTLTM